MLTSGPILGTLVEVVNEQRCDVVGVVDDTQVDQVFGQWRTNGVSAWKIPLRRILEGAPSAARSRRVGSRTVHDFMHAKVVVADDTSFVGSFNFSRSGERNAENVLEIRDRGVADRLARLRRRDTRSLSGGNAARLRASTALWRRFACPRSQADTRTECLPRGHTLLNEPELLGV